MISLRELSAGVQYAWDPVQRQQAIDAFREDVSMLGIDEEGCKIFGRERGRLRKAGQFIGDIDLLIAATGLHYSLTVLTNNCLAYFRA